MPLIATYPNADEAAPAIQALRQESIPVETKTVEEDGLEITELHVPEDHFDKACDIIEQAHENLVRQKNRHRCRGCGADDLERCEVDRDKSVTGITYVLRCRKCGRLMPV